MLPPGSHAISLSNAAWSVTGRTTGSMRSPVERIVQVEDAGWLRLLLNRKRQWQVLVAHPRLFTHQHPRLYPEVPKP